MKDYALWREAVQGGLPRPWSVHLDQCGADIAILTGKELKHHKPGHMAGFRNYLSVHPGYYPKEAANRDSVC